MEGGEADFVCDYGTGGCSCVGCYYDTAVELTSYDRCARACCFGEGHALGGQSCVAVVVGEVEAGHVGGLRRRNGRAQAGYDGLQDVMVLLGDSHASWFGSL